MSRAGRPQGPQCLRDVLSWPDMLLRRLVAYDAWCGTELARTFTKNMANGVVLTTSYSGMGSAEVALKMLERVAKESHAASGSKTEFNGVI